MMTIPGVSVAVPEMAVLMAPYLFDSYAEEDFILDRFLAPTARRPFKKLVPAVLIVHEPTPEQRAAWKCVGVSTHQDLIARLGGESRKLYDAMVAGKKAYAETAETGREPAASR
jgi:hypothetical protein